MSRLREDIERCYRLHGVEGALPCWKIWINCFHPRMAPVVLVRLSEISYRHGFRVVSKLLAIVNVVVFGIEVSPRVEIGGGLFLPHTVGTVIGAERIGENCTIMQGVTLGAADTDLGFTPTARPIIGNGVMIGSGAKVIGRVTVGDRASIGANSVVLTDVPPDSLAVGVPARIISKADRSTTA